jgi:hypothetical protein
MDSIGFGVGHTVEYGRFLEEAHDKKYAICAPAVQHYISAAEQGLHTLYLHGIPPEQLYAYIEDILTAMCSGLAFYTESWARVHKEWDRKTGNAEDGLVGLVVKAGRAEAL